MLKQIIKVFIEIILCFIFLACKKESSTEQNTSASPAVKIISPLNNAIITDTTTVRIAVTGSKNISRVELFIDSVLQKTFTAAPYNYVLDVRMFRESTVHTLYARAFKDESIIATTPLVRIQSLRTVVTFIKTYGGSGLEVGYSVKQTMDGGYIIAGSKESGNTNVFLVKTDKNGDTSWAKTYGGNENEYAQNIEQTSDGGYIVGGKKVSSSFIYQNYIIKTDEYGNEVWEKQYGAANSGGFTSICETGDGSYVVAGTSGGSYENIYLIKLNVSGDTVWTKTYAGEGVSLGYCVRQMSDGGFIVLGETMQIDTVNYHVYLVRTDEDGDTLWTKTIILNSEDEGRSLEVTGDGGCVIVGYYANGVFLIKMDRYGNKEWDKTYPEINQIEGNGVVKTLEGGYMLTGSIWDGGTEGAPEIFLLKTDAGGNELMYKTYTYGLLGYCLIQTNDGGFAITGVGTSEVNQMDDVFLLKLDTNGEIFTKK